MQPSIWSFFQCPGFGGRPVWDRTASAAAESRARGTTAGREDHPSPRVRLVVVLLFGPAVLVVTTFAFVLALHMLLEGPGFSLYFFFARRPLPHSLFPLRPRLLQ